MGRYQQITARERAILFALAGGIVTNWKDAYILSHQKPEAEVAKQSAINSTVSRWKQRIEIQNEYKNAVAIFENMRATTPAKHGTQENGTECTKEENEKTPGDNVRTEPQQSKRNAVNVDYSNPANQTRKLNELVNTAQDPGEALDALKVIIASQKADRESAREGKRVVFYTPLRCKDCPLYERATEKARKALQ